MYIGLGQYVQPLSSAQIAYAATVGSLLYSATNDHVSRAAPPPRHTLPIITAHGKSIV